MIRYVVSIACLCGLLCPSTRAGNGAQNTVPPRFEAVHRLLADHVAQQRIAGAVGLVMDRSKVVYSDAVGFSDAETQVRMTHETLFRIASMTKPVTSVAVMMLLEEGKLKLSDPLSKYIPEFDAPNVLAQAKNGEYETQPAHREITIHDLLTHTSGITYAFFGEPHNMLYRDSEVSDGLIETPVKLAENVRRLAKLPLANRPGEAWQYGLSTDVLGRVVEIASGQTLDVFFRQRIFQPLGMRDTHFYLPDDKVERLAAQYRPNDNGRIERVGDGPQNDGGLTYSATYQFKGPRSYYSGGAGLVSTATDYARFLKMLAQSGGLDDVRLLKPESVAAVTQNQIGQLTTAFAIHGDKFGYGFGVHSGESDRNGASIGTYSWGGIFHTYFWVDPKRDVIGIVLTQLFPFDHLTLWADFQRRAYDALDAAIETRDAPGPQPGDVYREFATHNGGNRNWRVTDPRATVAGAHDFLPNPVLSVEIDELDHAVRAEVLLDRWGGHLGTTNKRVRFNGHPWLTIPELTTTPKDRAEFYYSQDNPIIEVPLGHLQKGINTFEGTCDALEDHGWGQWGLYSLLLRIYYDPNKTEHCNGRIVTPIASSTFDENPVVKLECLRGAARVDVFAWYDGYDEDGDGVFRDWHGSRHQPMRGAAATLLNHVGTVCRKPYELIWNTRWVPDQPASSVKLIARVQHERGVWSVTQPVEALTLQREGGRVVLYRAKDVPERFGVRVGQKRACAISIPRGERLRKAAGAVLPVRTWHGYDRHHEPLHLNGHPFAIDGKNHHYGFDLLPIPTNVLRPGDNVFTIDSKTEHHMLEVLWPGPALIVRYAESD